MIPPPAPLLGQINGEVDNRNGSSSWRHFLGEWHDQDRTVPGVEVESGGSVSQENVSDLHALADRVHRLLGAKAKHLHRLGQLLAILVRHLVAGIDVENQLADRHLRPVGEDNAFTRLDLAACGINPHGKVIAGKPEGTTNSGR